MKKKSTRKTIQWTTARKRNFLVSLLRSGTRRWPPKYEALANAYIETRINPKSGRLAKHYQCAICSGAFTSTSMEIDHIKPVVGAEGFTTWDSFIERLFCPVENLQAVCKTCHKEKTKREAAERKR